MLLHVTKFVSTSPPSINAPPCWRPQMHSHILLHTKPVHTLHPHQCCMRPKKRKLPGEPILHPQQCHMPSTIQMHGDHTAAEAHVVAVYEGAAIPLLIHDAKVDGIASSLWAVSRGSRYCLTRKPGSCRTSLRPPQGSRFRCPGPPRGVGGDSAYTPNAELVIQCRCHIANDDV